MAFGLSGNARTSKRLPTDRPWHIANIDQISALRPQLSAAPFEALERGQAFSVPFVVTKVGLIPVTGRYQLLYSETCRLSGKHQTNKAANRKSRPTWPCGGPLLNPSLNGGRPPRSFRPFRMAEHGTPDRFESGTLR